MSGLPGIALADWQAQGHDFLWHGQRIRYWTAGEGEPLLLIHGFPTASWDWHYLWQPLAQRYRVVACDMLGFGYSAKPRGHAYSLLEQADLQQALLVRKGDDMDGQNTVLGAIRAQNQRARQVPGLEIGDELRLADKIDDGLPAIGGNRQTELRLGCRVAEFDGIVAIEQDDSIGQRLTGGDQHVDLRNPAFDLPPQILFVAVDARKDAIPSTQRFKAGMRCRRPRPAIEAGKVAQLEAQLQRKPGAEDRPADPRCDKTTEWPGNDGWQQNQQQRPEQISGQPDHAPRKR